MRRETASRQVGKSASRQAFVIGLTGNIACGKSTVVRMLAERGAAAMDADAVYHELISPGKPLWDRLRARYGDGILAADGTIDRRALGGIVFATPTTLAELDALTHPAVVAEIRNRLATSDADVVVVDAVKLIESGLADECDRVWLVTCSAEQQVNRLMTRNGLSREDAARRVAVQPSLAAKLERADVVIDNSGTVEETSERVEEAWQRIAEHPNALTPQPPLLSEGEGEQAGPVTDAAPFSRARRVPSGRGWG